MNQLMKKLKNYHHKTSSDYISKQKPKNQIISSAMIFKTNAMNIKINDISNSNERYIFIPNSKAINGRSFDKDLQEKKKIKTEKVRKDSDKNSLELESKDKLSTNNLTETLQHPNDNIINLKEGQTNVSNKTNCNYNNYINNNINKRISTINHRNKTKGNYIPTISINIKKKDNENRMKANIDVKTKTKNKKCLFINDSNIIKKSNNNNASNSNINGNKINESFNKDITRDSFENKICKKTMHNSYKKEKNKEKKLNFQTKDIYQAKQKTSNNAEENTLNKGLIPLKSKTQNYLNISNNVNKYINYYSNRKKSKKTNVNDNYNNSYENTNINHLINSKKKLLIKKKDKNNKENKENRDNKESSSKKNKNKSKNGLNNIKSKKKNVILLKSVSEAKKLLRTKSPLNCNTITVSDDNKFENNSILNQNLTYKDFFAMKNNTYRQNEEDNNNNSSIKNLIENTTNNNNTYSDKDQKDINESNISKKCSSMKKNNSKNKKINNNIIITKNEKNLEKNLIKKSSSNKNIIIENSSDENNLSKNKNLNPKDKSFQNSTPIINKVLIFEIGNSKMLNNINNLNNNSNLNDSINMINMSNSNNYSYKNIIHLDNKNIDFNNNINKQSTPKKNKITDIIKKNIKYNKENKILNYIDNSHSINNNISDSFFGENLSTPINHKHSFIKNKKFLEFKNNISENNINKLSNYKNKFKYIKVNEKDKEKEKEKDNVDIHEMETPILLNTPKLNGRIIDAKLNLFEKVKNIKMGKDIINKKIKKNQILNNLYKEDNSTEIEDINYHELSIPSNKNTLNNTKYKNKTELKFKHKKSINCNLSNILLLDKDCKELLFDFFDLSMLNAFTLLNKKYYNCFKFIINEKIKNKILNFYKDKDKEKENCNINKIKLSLMKFSSLSKMSPILLHKKYIDLLLEKNSKYDKEIQKDLTRTFPNDSTFKYGNSNYNKLYHLLTVYSLYNQKIGYAQGINFLVAHIIPLFNKEEDAFVFLDALLQKFEFEKLLGVENELQNKLNKIGFYFKTYCPEVYNYLDSMNLSHEFFTTNWMITLFSNAMNDKHLFIVWDYLIIYGWKFFKYFVISILNIYKDSILEEEQNNLTYYMKNILKTEKFEQKFQDIINQVFILMNNDNNN